MRIRYLYFLLIIAITTIILLSGCAGLPLTDSSSITGTPPLLSDAVVRLVPSPEMPVVSKAKAVTPTSTLPIIRPTIAAASTPPSQPTVVPTASPPANPIITLTSEFTCGEHRYYGPATLADIEALLSCSAAPLVDTVAGEERLFVPNCASWLAAPPPTLGDSLGERRLTSSINERCQTLDYLSRAQAPQSSYLGYQPQELAEVLPQLPASLMPGYAPAAVTNGKTLAELMSQPPGTAAQQFFLDSGEFRGTATTYVSLEWRRGAGLTVGDGVLYYEQARTDLNGDGLEDALLRAEYYRLGREDEITYEAVAITRRGPDAPFEVLALGRD